MKTRSEKSIFFDALEIESPEDRSNFLRVACGDDTQLRAAVSDLLAQHERDDHLVDHPVVGDAFGSSKLDATTEPRLSGPEWQHPPGTVIGAYKLRELIGEGGFGLVYVADQERPVRRRVALKIIKPGMRTKEVLARFGAERQALALMDHPNIARVFDAGLTESGQPYFVMELVRGIPLTTFCDNHRLSTHKRIDLLIKVCYALQHAHQKGIIHRDLKPSNILVTLLDGDPLPKVIDFGVAKAIGEPLTTDTIYTRFTSMIGTPAYMSPEQADMTTMGVDTRSDIYSLGVLLYELLTGSPPLTRDRLETAGFDDLRRMIREEEPARPSARLGSLDQATLSTVSQVRHCEPTRLVSMLQGDLDWIVLKALDKNRQRRYATAGEMAEDLNRFLTGQPVAARPPTIAYRFSRFARRNKVALVSAAAIAVALLMGTATSIWQASIAMTERDAASAALLRARVSEAEAIAARRELEAFTERLQTANTLLASGHAHERSDRWSDAHTDYTKAIETQPKYSQVWSERGSLYARLGLWEQAADDFEQSVRLGGAASRADFLGVPQLLWHTGRREMYDRVCRQLQALKDDRFAVEMRSRLIGELTVDEAATISETAEQQLAEHEDAEDSEGKHFFHRGLPIGPLSYVAGWAHLKAGHTDRAAERLRESLDSNTHWRHSGIAYPLLAIALQQSGQTEAAWQTLEQSRQWYETGIQEALASNEFMPRMPWFDWVEFLEHHRIAEHLIAGEDPSADVRLEHLRDKAKLSIE